MTRLFAFDMDGTLLSGRTILYLGEEFGFYEKALEIIDSDSETNLISQKLAKFLRGRSVHDFMKVMKKIPITDGAEETIRMIESWGDKTAIITDSYDIAAEYFRKKLGIDRAVGNTLILDDGVITGELEMLLNCPTPGDCGYPSICKNEVLKSLSSELKISLSDTVAIGDNRIDMCMIRAAGIGVAFNPKVKELEDAADLVIKSNSLSKLLEYTRIK